jgi:hypothetical protein
MTNKYVNGLIYKIVCNDTNEQYYGSTIQTLAQRLSDHVSSYNKALQGSKGKVSSYSIIERNNYKIVLVEAFPCNNKMELERQERKFIEENVCLNKVIPGRTRKEYKQDNKANIIEKGKKYRQDNKDVIAARAKEYYCDNKAVINERAKEYYYDNKAIYAEKAKEKYNIYKAVINEKTKQYRANNVEKVKDYARKYRQDNKDKRKEYVRKYRQDNKAIMNERERIKYYYKKAIIKGQQETIIKGQHEAIVLLLLLIVHIINIHKTLISKDINTTSNKMVNK